jgi:predicted Rossmann-fold nucleotide-binding protein
VRGYYQPLIAFLDHAVREGFLSVSHRRMIMLEEDPEVLVSRLWEYEAPIVPKWIVAGET